MSDLAKASAAVRAAIHGLEPGVLPAEACRSLIEDLARTEKVCALARVRLAERAAGSVNRPGSAENDAAELLARAKWRIGGVGEVRPHDGARDWPDSRRSAARSRLASCRSRRRTRLRRR